MRPYKKYSCPYKEVQQNVPIEISNDLNKISSIVFIHNDNQNEKLV